MSILSVQDISKSYKLRKVVKTLSVEIKSGEVVGLLGPNGAGKTTAFYMIVGLIPADKGTILLDGHDLTALPMHRRARMGLGYLPQEASIFRKLTVEQNILAILENREDLDRAGREKELENLLDELHGDGATLITVTHNPVYAERATRRIRMLDGRIVDDIEQNAA